MAATQKRAGQGTGTLAGSSSERKALRKLTKGRKGDEGRGREGEAGVRKNEGTRPKGAKKGRERARDAQLATTAPGRAAESRRAAAEKRPKDRQKYIHYQNAARWRRTEGRGLPFNRQ